jgi:hypothetical protein
VTTAEAALAAGDWAAVFVPIEGFRTSRLAFGTANAQPVSIGFWTKIHRTGMYSGSIENSASNRSYPFTFTQNVADTWQFNTVTIPGDVTGTWVGNTNGTGFNIWFVIASGTTVAGTANAWAAANLIAATGTTNGVAATSDVFQITGVIVLPGVELPSSSRAALIMRPVPLELPLCQRYYVKSFGQSVAVAQNAGDRSNALYYRAIVAGGAGIGGTIYLPCTMRTAGTATAYNPAAANANARNYSTNVDAGTVGFSVGDHQFWWVGSQDSAATAGQDFQFHYTVDARL